MPGPAISVSLMPVSSRPTPSSRHAPARYLNLRTGWASKSSLEKTIDLPPSRMGSPILTWRWDRKGWSTPDKIPAPGSEPISTNSYPERGAPPSRSPHAATASLPKSGEEVDVKKSVPAPRPTLGPALR